MKQKLADKILSIPLEVCTPTNPHYQEYRIGLQRSAVGVGAVIGGLILNALTGSEIGVDMAAAGGTVILWGAPKMANEMGELNQQIM